MRSVDVFKNFFRTAVWNAPNRSVPRTACVGLSQLLRADERPLRRGRLSNHRAGVTGLIIALTSLIVLYQANAQASSTCATGKTMCGTRCVNLSTAPRNCGACGVVCGAGKTCKAGMCATTGSANSTTTRGANSTCAAGKTMCGTRCVNVSTAPRNCGACGVVCGAGKTCKAGVCAATGSANSTTTSDADSTCAAGKAMCGTRCVNLSTAPRNCGACGVVCGAGQRCTNGVCGCASGQPVSGGCRCMSGQAVNGVCQ